MFYAIENSRRNLQRCASCSRFDIDKEGIHHMKSNRIVERLKSINKKIILSSLVLNRNECMLCLRRIEQKMFFVKTEKYLELVGGLKSICLLSNWTCK